MIPAIERLPRVRLGVYPTPLIEARHLSSVLGGPKIFIKREDMSGLAMGGNKCRKLEFIMAEALKQGANWLISTASSQSNFCLQLAAAGRRFGMKSSFALLRGVHVETQGNLLLQNILGSEVEILEMSDIHEAYKSTVSKRLDQLAENLRSRGYRPFIMRHALPDISAILGAVGWAMAADELNNQLKDQGIRAQYVLLANGGGASQAGLAWGLKYLKARCQVIGISVLNPEKESISSIIENADALSGFLGIDMKLQPDESPVFDSYIGEGYGIPTKEGVEAIRLVAQTEGIFLDPVYSGKAMAGFIDLIKKGYFSSEETVVFIHSGGIPALFAYHQEMTR